MNSELVLQSLERNPESSTRGVSGEVGISLSNRIRHLHNLGKSTWSSQIMAYVHKILQNLWLTLVNRRLKCIIFIL